ncbi:MAG: hypothetical protein EOO73_06385 [Myxococcales bacterium]|nr:MAG: hypothetical protein EOO73_06385 [Myxococcales bacterium]
MDSPKRPFEITWPLFGDDAQPFPADPERTVHDLEPPSAQLDALKTSADAPESGERLEQAVRRMRESLPPAAPDWMRAARSLADWLELRIKRGHVTPLEEATIARTWAAFSLAGVTEQQVHKIARVVQRAHSAIRETPRSASELQLAINACAGVLYAGLPRPVRERMPLERVVATVRKLREQADPWAAIVEGVADLAGWKDYSRIHAASVIRAVLESRS